MNIPDDSDMNELIDDTILSFRKAVDSGQPLDSIAFKIKILLLTFGKEKVLKNLDSRNQNWNVTTIREIIVKINLSVLKVGV